MKKGVSGTTDEVRQALFYIPVTGYFVVFTALLGIGLKLLSNHNINAATAYSDIYSLLVRIAVAFTLIAISFSLLSVLISYFHYLYHKKKTGIECKIETDSGEAELHEKQTVKLFIKPILKPTLGFIRIRLLYDGNSYSDKFSIAETGKKSSFNTRIEGTYNWPLPEIREYHVDKAIIYFEDIFQFFSIAVTVPANNRFFTRPATKTLAELKVSPRKTEETTTRIEQLRKVEGEFLNYKNFENNDDVRRIVWKIYAKNKELVVRIPEIMDPYASHVYLYASFFSHFSVEGIEPVQVPFLNYYKVIIWSVYQNLIKQGFDVRFIPDREVSSQSSSDPQQAVKYSISTSIWHHDKDLKTYLKPADASVAIISSLSNADEVQYLMEHYGSEITFIFVKLTDSFKKQNVLDWVQWLFVENEKGNVNTYKRIWSFSPLRLKLIDNERKLEEMLRQFDGVQV